MFTWFWTNSFGYVHRLWVCLFVTLISHTLTTHTFIHSRTHPLQPADLQSKQHQVSEAAASLTSQVGPEASIGFMVYMFESRDTLLPAGLKYSHTLEAFGLTLGLYLEDSPASASFISKQWRRGGRGKNRRSRSRVRTVHRFVWGWITVSRLRPANTNK